MPRSSEWFLPSNSKTTWSVAMKFLEWYFCKSHTCILRAYWEGSPSKCSPWANMHLAQRCCLPLLQKFTKLSFQCYCHTLLGAFVCSFKSNFIFGNGHKSFEAKSGEQGECSTSVIDFWARNCLTESDLWAGALSWWRIQSLVQIQVILHAQIHVTASVFHINKVDWLFRPVEWIQSEQ
jgi:hypothetical protein